MLSPANQYHFILTLEGADFQVLSFKGREALNTPFEFELELVSERAFLDLESLLHQLAFLQFAPNGRGIHGLVYSIAQGEAGKRLTRYRISLRPKLAYLAHQVNQRIFQQRTVPQIITQVLEEHGILAGDYTFQLSALYPERLYCVQYDESDLHFIQRLCEEEGIHFHFQHSAQDHVLAFGDDQTVFPKLDPVHYQQDTGLVADTPMIKRFGLRVATRTSRVTRRDYDFAKPRIELESAARSAAQPDLEDYDYPGRFDDRERGKHLANRSLERHRSDYQLAEGRSDQPLLASGHFLPLTDHANGAWNNLWLLTEIIHEGKQPQVLEEVITSDVNDLKDDFHQGYRNQFSAIPWDVLYRPPLNHPKPKVLGSQSAMVTGPEGEEIHCDEYGRVKVQFYWDREGEFDDKTSCWMRVASNWASQNFGAINLPRIGMEVLITFLEGDPDQPLITGCLYHGANLPPYKLPDFKTLATVKSKEYKGSRANELRIDDTTSEISIALRSDHGASAINLGYLTHPRPSGGQPRGEGFELRTDRHGAVRAAAGLLITTEPRPNESKHHKDLPETAERLATASDQQDGFSMQAIENQAQEAGDQDEVAKALHIQHRSILGSGPANLSANEFPEFTQPHLVLASPAGIALTTSQSTHIAAGEHLALSSTSHISLSVGQKLLASASRGMRLFVQSLGWRLVAASGDIDMRALKDSINLLAKLNITANADRITLTAKTELVIQGGGSATTYNAGGITHATSGPYTAHAANFAYIGAKSLAGVFPEPPKPGKGHLELLNQYAGRQGIRGSEFEVKDALGHIFNDMLDAIGFATVFGAAPGPARVKFCTDPVDTWSGPAYIGQDEWPLNPPSAEDAPSQVQIMVAKTLTSADGHELPQTKKVSSIGAVVKMGKLSPYRLSGNSVEDNIKPYAETKSACVTIFKNAKKLAIARLTQAHEYLSISENQNTALRIGKIFYGSTFDQEDLTKWSEHIESVKNALDKLKTSKSVNYHRVKSGKNSVVAELNKQKYNGGVSGGRKYLNVYVEKVVEINNIPHLGVEHVAHVAIHEMSHGALNTEDYQYIGVMENPGLHDITRLASLPMLKNERRGESLTQSQRNEKATRIMSSKKNADSFTTATRYLAYASINPDFVEPLISAHDVWIKNGRNQPLLIQYMI